MVIRRVRGGPWFRAVPPTYLRTLTDSQGHLPPKSGVDLVGGPWLGTSRVLNRAARRKENRRTWQKELRTARRLGGLLDEVES